jgi:hypothetical protein
VTSKAELDNVKIGIKLLGYLGESNYSCITSLVALYLTEGISHGDEVLFSHFLSFCLFDGSIIPELVELATNS